MGQISTIPAAQDALKAALAARAEFAGVKVDLGTPPRGPKKTHAWVETASENWTVEPETTGPIATSSFQESYDIFVWILAVKSGDRPKTARDRAFELLAGLIAALRVSDQLGGVFGMYFAGGEAGPATHDGSIYFAMRVRIKVTAYLA